MLMEGSAAANIPRRAPIVVCEAMHNEADGA
jgi:hypothetical protein